jgi:hypothetical protein
MGFLAFYTLPLHPFVLLFVLLLQHEIHCNSAQQKVPTGGQPAQPDGGLVSESL